MVKKLFLTVGLFLTTMMCSAQVVLIEFQVSYGNPNEHTVSRPRGPIEAPTVYIEDYSLSFETNHPDYVLNIKDEDGEVVYTTTVYSAVTLVTLPSTLSGDYEIELVYGNWIFTGYINL